MGTLVCYGFCRLDYLLGCCSFNICFQLDWQFGILPVNFMYLKCEVCGLLMYKTVFLLMTELGFLLMRALVLLTCVQVYMSPIVTWLGMRKR